MKNLKIYIDEVYCPEGWILCRDLDEFMLLLATVNLEDILIISFDFLLGSLDFSDPDGCDCAVHLIEVANGRRLPQCVIHSKHSHGIRRITEVIDHYNKSWNYDDECTTVDMKAAREEKVGSL